MLIAAAGGGRGDGRGTVVTVVVFSSSSKNTIDGVGSTEEQVPAVVPVWLVERSFRNTPPTEAEARHTIQLDVVPPGVPLSNQRAAYLRPSGSRSSPKP